MYKVIQNKDFFTFILIIFKMKKTLGLIISEKIFKTFSQFIETFDRELK